MKKTSISLLIAATFALNACSPSDTKDSAATQAAGTQPAAASSSVPDTELLATVNGVSVPMARERVLLEQIQQANPTMQLTAEILNEVKDNIITQEVLAQEATRLGLADTEIFREQIGFMSRSLLTAALYEDFSKKNPVSDEVVTAEYNNMLAQFEQTTANSGQEFLARHILVASEEDAKRVMNELQNGADFTILASEYSIDPGSAKEGGMLGWAVPNMYVNEFATALRDMKKGDTSTVPVQSQFGWHIIRVDDVRDVPNNNIAMPPLDDSIKEQLRRSISERNFLDYQEQLVQQANVVIPQ